MVSFQAKLAKGLQKRNYEICFSLSDRPYDAVLIVGGTRDLAGLWKARREGLPVVQRLNGMNWLHRKRRTGFRHYLRSEYGNFLLALIRSQLATRIVYQSWFARSWWERVFGTTKAPASIVYNGVDLSIFNPEGTHYRSELKYQVLLVEGNLGGGYETGLETAVLLGQKLQAYLPQPVEIAVVGKVAPELRARWQRGVPLALNFLGVVSHEKIPEVDRSAHLLFAADLNAACPNSVIEALGCGLPVISFDTGALPELVIGDAGRIVPYGGNPWELDPPNLAGLAEAAGEVLQEPSRFRKYARDRAEQEFDVEQMVEGYLAALKG